MPGVITDKNLLVSEKQIQKRLKELADEINSKYTEVTLLVTLTGGVYTAVDLSKHITIPCKLEFVKISSYGHEQEQGIIELKWMSVNKGRHLGNVIVIDDVFDTGNTLTYLTKYIKNNYTYDSLDTLCLLDKPGRRNPDVDLTLTYTGFVINDEFVYGYGLDLKEYDRNLTDILYIA